MESTMATSRRIFIQSICAGAAGVGMPASSQFATGYTPRQDRAECRKMVVRADDIGMSKFCNFGAFEAIENGVVTAAAIMLADPGTEDALERLKAYPWISVDWHI